MFDVSATIYQNVCELKKNRIFVFFQSWHKKLRDIFRIPSWIAV